MKRFSESQCLTKLSLQGSRALSEEELYRAAVFRANCGELLPESQHLPVSHRLLLDVRVLIAKRKLAEASQLLTRANELPNLGPEILGDIPYLRGMLAYRNGQWELAGKLMEQAKFQYLKSNDLHRSLRSAINQEIAHEDLASFQSGALYALKQEALREKAYDLAGNIAKAHAIDVLKAGSVEECFAAASSALQSYNHDGCPEDRSLAACMKALSSRLLGHIEESLAAEGFIYVTTGKVKEYYDTWTIIKSGKVPHLTPEHPLTKVNWQSITMKASSVSGKILGRLRQGPATKYELIEHVWGIQAIDPSYESRLFSALYNLKRKYGTDIAFDGEKYKTN